MKKKYLVVGLGKTGLSSVNYLEALGHKIWATDQALSGDHLKVPEVTFIPMDECFSLMEQLDEVIVSPGVPLNLPLLVYAREQGIPIIGDVECFARVVKAPVIGVTGTNGKGTVVSLITHLLRACGYSVGLGGNIGIPVLDLLKDPIPHFYVLELSSFQLETTYSLSTEVATILNISPDHLDRHGSLAHYAQAKQRIYHKANYAIANEADPLTFPLAPFEGKTFYCSSLHSTGGFTIHGDQICYKHKPLLDLEVLKIKGAHNVFNVLVALTVLEALGIDFQGVIGSLKDFRGLPHRCEWITGNKPGVIWINDSKATNIGAAMAALESIGKSIPGKIIWLGGGQGKGVDFSPLRESVRNYVSCGILFGEDKALLYESLKNTVPLMKVDSLKDAVEQSYRLAQEGDAVLLSPACASLDMFHNYEHRGQLFTEYVRDYND